MVLPEVGATVLGPLIFICYLGSLALEGSSDSSCGHNSLLIEVLGSQTPRQGPLSSGTLPDTDTAAYRKVACAKAEGWRLSESLHLC